jgi:hypothetical protein
MKYKVEDISQYFQLPISYNDKKMDVSDNVKSDLELSNIKDGESLYNVLFTNDNECSKQTSELWNKYYTYDKKFIKDTQRMLKKKYVYDFKDLTCWDKIKGDNEFNDRYQFININALKFLNESSMVLQCLCFYKFMSPLITLIYPIIMMFVPFILMRYWNKVNISYGQYYSILKLMIMSNSLVKLFTEFSLSNWRQTVYLLFSAGMYIFSLYQNIISCVEFHSNMKYINNYVIELKEYIKTEVMIMNDFQTQCNNLSTYQPFIENMNHHKEVLIKSLDIFETVMSYSWNFHNLSHMGYSLKTLYFIYYNEDFHNAIMYSFGFNGYIYNIHDIQQNIKDKNIHIANISKTTKFTKAYYPIFKKTKHIKNSYSLKDNLIISGPNASGKTTLIKTTLFNILISQQIGYGFYEKANVKLYKHIHSYLNIPDTSDRDSLFQAEARRCREIIDVLNKDEKASHFCIFDELYSGTNPYEANASAYAFIKYMLRQNIDFMLTTHFVELCENLDKELGINNSQMNIKYDNDEIVYLYKLIAGISKYKGGIHVLKELHYPEEIIQNTKYYLQHN